MPTHHNHLSSRQITRRGQSPNMKVKPKTDQSIFFEAAENTNNKIAVRYTFSNNLDRPKGGAWSKSTEHNMDSFFQNTDYSNMKTL